MTSLVDQHGNSVSPDKESNRLIWWLLATMLSLLMLVGGGSMAGLYARVAQAERENTVQSVQIASVEQAYRDVARRLESIETKLDRVLSGNR